MFITVYPVPSRSQIVEVFLDFLLLANLGKVCKIQANNFVIYVPRIVLLDKHQQTTIRAIMAQLRDPSGLLAIKKDTPQRNLSFTRAVLGLQAVLYAAYLHNRTYCHRIECIPFKLVYNIHPNLAKLMGIWPKRCSLCPQKTQ